MKRLLLPFLLLVALSAGAQLRHDQINSLVNTSRIVNMEGEGPRVIKLNQSSRLDSVNHELDSLRGLVANFYYDQFRHSQDPDAPTFLFMSKSARLLMGIGGAVRMRGYLDWGGAIPGPAFAPYLIPIPADPANMRHLGTTPAGTCLYFSLTGRFRYGTYKLYIEANFNGYNARDFHLKKAYAMLGPWTVGYANSTFSDPAAMAPCVDAQGATNKLSATSVLIRYMPQLSKHWSVAVSLETPSEQIDIQEGKISTVSTWLPDAAAFVQYEWSRGQHVRLAGIVRQLSYRNLILQKNHNIAGWGLQLSSVANPLPQVTTYVSLNYGRGYAGLVNDLLAGKYDLVGDPDRPGVLYAPRAFGYSIGVQYNILSNLFISGNFSQTRYLPDHRVSPDEYKYGWCTDFNVFWNIRPRIQVGAEFDLGYRRNVSGAHRIAKRAGAMCQFSF